MNEDYQRPPRAGVRIGLVGQIVKLAATPQQKEPVREAEDGFGEVPELVASSKGAQRQQVEEESRAAIWGRTDGQL